MMICNSFKIGEMAVATSTAEEYGFTCDKEYSVLDSNGEYVLIENDHGEPDWYSLEYFWRKNKPLVYEAEPVF